MPIKDQTTPDVSIVNGQAVTTSKAIADFFHKQHKDVLRKVETLMADLPIEYHQRNFTPTVESRVNPSGGTPLHSPVYQITRDGFTLLAMSFTGAAALQWKLAYIQAFNQLEAERLLPLDDVKYVIDRSVALVLMLICQFEESNQYRVHPQHVMNALCQVQVNLKQITSQLKLPAQELSNARSY